MNEKLGLTEHKNIVAAILRTYNIDFSEFALTSIKRRFEKVFGLYNFKDVDDFILKIENDCIFFENLLYEISIEETEMFRDPPTWEDIKDNIFPKFDNDTDFKIWLPDTTSGDELYSTLILLKEAKLSEKAQIYATSIASKCISQVKSGYIDLKKVETNTSNYRRLRTEFQFSKYIDLEEKKAILDNNLLKNVIFLKHDLLKEKAPANFKIIIFRNKLIYYNPLLQEKILEILYNSLLPGGYLIIGINEFIENSAIYDKISLVNPTENIYKRIKE